MVSAFSGLRSVFVVAGFAIAPLCARAQDAQAEKPAPGAIVRYSEPLGFGLSAVRGLSLEALSSSTPLFPPIEGLDDILWKVSCATCHKWTRQALCEQGREYAQNPAEPTRTRHPFGGSFKIGMMEWARTGCQ